MTDLIEELIVDETDRRVHEEWLRALRQPEFDVVPTDELPDEMEVSP